MCSTLLFSTQLADVAVPMLRTMMASVLPESAGSSLPPAASLAGLASPAPSIGEPLRLADAPMFEMKETPLFDRHASSVIDGPSSAVFSTPAQPTGRSTAADAPSNPVLASRDRLAAMMAQKMQASTSNVSASTTTTETSPTHHPKPFMSVTAAVMARRSAILAGSSSSTSAARGQKPASSATTATPVSSTAAVPRTVSKTPKAPPRGLPPAASRDSGPLVINLQQAEQVLAVFAHVFRCRDLTVDADVITHLQDALFAPCARMLSSCLAELGRHHHEAEASHAADLFPGVHALLAALVESYLPSTLSPVSQGASPSPAAIC